MRLNLFDCGLIDEVLYEVSQASIEQIGIARYKVTLNGKRKFEFDLWTTIKGRLSFISGDEYFPTWMSVKKDEDNLNFLIANDCTFHLEHCDRGLYSLNISRGEDMFCGSISTKGYIKTKLIENDETNS